MKDGNITVFISKYARYYLRNSFWPTAIVMALVQGFLSVSCGKKNSEVTPVATATPTQSETSVEVTAANLVGKWKIKEARSKDAEVTFSGAEYYEFFSDGSFVYASQDLKVGSGDTCTASQKGSYSIADKSKIVTVFVDEIGNKPCLVDDFNPVSTTVKKITRNTFVVINGDVELTYEKIDSSSHLDYDTLARKFEDISVTVDDPDKPAGFSLAYRSPRSGGWRFLCSRLAGQSSSGFETTPTFTYNGFTYETWMQFDEGEIEPVGYDSVSPRFSFQKRSADSTDSVGYPGSGRYGCSNTSDCAGKCTLKFNEYSLIDSKANLTITCANLPAGDANDTDNLFGETLTGFSMNVKCDYKPDLQIE